MNEENVEEVKLLEDHIERLQAEVANLQQQWQNHKDLTFHFSEQMQRALSHVCGQTPQGTAEEVLSGLKEEVEQLEEDLQRQSQMNGISIKSCNVRSVQRSSTKLVQQMCVSGYCSELEFQVEFQLSEVKEGEQSERKINSLNVVMDASDLQDFGSFLSGVEESRDLLCFFRTLRTFSDRVDERRQTFQHFQAKYPTVVSLPGGCRSEVMTLHHPELPGCILSVHWSVEVSKEGSVTPKVHLLTKIPEKAQQLFPSEAIGGAATAFHSLLRLVGPEAALECIIREVGLLQDL
ncbi:centromere protein P [Dunckerocampus dactyliophorus]|uniref:centromere protein P n=1 Tax=Dunckerocampus dactyliophorus TaxID=161453 RepID=UPI002406213D|nr:centromere protein P [Dunckerocampus dactyliophorus]